MGLVRGSRACARVAVIALLVGLLSALGSGPAHAALPDGTFVATPQGAVYRFAGGAPIHVSPSFWEAVQPQPNPLPVAASAIEDPAGAAAAGVSWWPADGTFLQGHLTGAIYVVVGGAPLYVSHAMWGSMSTHPPVTAVAEESLDAAGDGTVWRAHLNRYPSDGTLLRAHDGSGTYRVEAGVARLDAATGGTTVDATSIAYAGTDTFRSHLVSEPPLMTSLTANVDAATATALVSWGSARTSSEVATYAARWRAPGGTWQSPSAWSHLPGTSLTDTGWESGEQRCYSVRALNRAAQTSDWYPEVCARMTTPHTPVDDPALTFSRKPRLVGRAKVGGVLKVRPGRWNPSDARARIRWSIDGRTLRKARGRTLRIRPAWRGRKVSATVTISAPGFASVSMLAGRRKIR